MRRVLVPLFASLLLCGVAAGALGVAGARAQTENTQTPSGADMGRAHRLDPADIAQRLKARCEDRYAGAVGRMAALETRLNLTGAQQSQFSAWRAVRLGIAKREADSCAQRDVSQMGKEMSPVDRMARMEDRLKKRVADLDAERPAFAALYNTLSPDQQKALRPDRRMRRGMWGHGMRGRDGMRPGMMRRGSMDGQPPAPQQ